MLESENEKSGLSFPPPLMQRRPLGSARRRRGIRQGGTGGQWHQRGQHQPADSLNKEANIGWI